MRNKGKNLSNIKLDNRSLVLKLLCSSQCNTRNEIANKTGLTKMTISNIVQLLIQDQWVYEGKMTDMPKPGRRSIYLHINEKINRSIGVYISRSEIVVSLISIRARIIKSKSYPLSRIETESSLIRKIFTGIKEITSKGSSKGIIGIGVAVLGPLDIKNGIVLAPLDFFGIKDFKIKEILEKMTGLPVFVNSDMNAAALAELLYGYGISYGSFIYFGITHGVGSAIVINGNLHLGSGGLAGEIGHVSIDYKGPICSCGNRGCLEMYASMPIFMKKVRNMVQKNPQSSLSNLEKLTFEDVIVHAKENDFLAENLVNELVEKIGIALIGSIHMLDNKVIIIGHESALGGDWLAEKIQCFINQHCMFKEIFPVTVMISGFVDKGSIVGSGVLVFQPLFK